jgi:hypothetical protein
MCFAYCALRAKSLVSFLFQGTATMAPAKPKRDWALERWKSDRRRFYARLGYAISRWAYVDEQLFTFCRFALGVSEKRAAIVFYRGQTIGEHFAVTDALMKAAQLQDRHLEQWARIGKKINDLLPFRNDIAHNPVVQAGLMIVVLDDVSNGPGHVKSNKDWQAIRTSRTKLIHRTKGTREIDVTEADMLAHIDAVSDLEDDMHDLRWSLLGPPRGVNPKARRPYIPRDLGSRSPQTPPTSKAQRPQRRSSRTAALKHKRR